MKSLRNLSLFMLVMILMALSCTLPIGAGENNAPNNENNQINQNDQDQNNEPANENEDNNQNNPQPEPQEEPTDEDWQPVSYEVYTDAAGKLYYVQDGQLMVEIDAGIQLDRTWGLLEALPQFQLSDKAVYWADYGEGWPFAKMADIEGNVSDLHPPVREGVLVNLLVSPNNDQLAWLYEVTPVDPNPFEECEPAQGCNGWDYHIFLTNIETDNPLLLASYNGGPTRVQPTLELLTWQNDGGAVFLRWDANVPGGFYKTTGGEIVKVDIPNGQITELTENWLYERTISPDGAWIGLFNDIDNKILLELNHTSGGGYAFANLFEGLSVISEPQFNPSITGIHWIQLQGGAGIGLLELRKLDLTDGKQSTVMDLYNYIDYGNSDTYLPVIGGWVDDVTVVLHTLDGSLKVNTQTGEATPFAGAGAIPVTAWYLGMIGGE